MNKYLCIILLLFLNTSVFPNDSRVVLGSSVEIINNENTNITMLEEEIIITLHWRYYEVDVSFDFYNDGDDENVLLGFPVWTVTSATHGYDFENQLLKNYFQNMPPSWYNENMIYKADPDFSEFNFNGFERKNIDYLSSLERSIISDDDRLSLINFWKN